MSPAPGRVAVIAIHGVGYHASGASAEAVTDLLEGVQEDAKDSKSKHRYGSFAPEEVQIALPPPICDTKPKRKFQYSFSALEERRGKMEKLSHLAKWFAHKTEDKTEHAALDIATEHMDTQLEDYTGDPAQNSYTTWRREGHRAGADQASSKFVDVYDMHWADLARPSNSFFRFLFSFYQLLLHLVSLGRTALDHAAYENFGKLDWFLYLRSYTYANRLLTLFILQLTVIIFGVAIAPLPLLIESAAIRAILAGSAAAIAGIVLVLWLGQAANPPFRLKSSWIFVPLAVIFGALIVLRLWAHWEESSAVLFVEWWILGAVVCILIALQYDQVRNGSKEVAFVFIFLTTLVLGILIYREHSFQAVHLRTASFYLVQYVFLALRILWILFFLLAAVTFLFECVCLVRLKIACDTDAKKNARARALAAARTARFALALPSLLILSLAIFTGSGVYKYLNKWEGLYKDVKPERMPPLLVKNLALDADETEKLLAMLKTTPPKPTDGCGSDAACMPQKNDSGKTQPGKSASSPDVSTTEVPGQNAPAKNASCENVPDQDAARHERNACMAVARAEQKVTESPNRFLEGIVYQSAPVGMIPSAILAGVGLLLLVMIVLPSVWFEIFPERTKSNGPSKRLGEWLSGGYRHFRWTITLLWVAAFAMPLGIMIYYGVQFCRSGSNDSFLFYLYSRSMMVDAANALISWGSIFAGSAVVLLGLIVKNFSAVLDAILDVDTYLRTSPQEATPRAQIVERYVALLGHLHGRVNARDNSPYYEKIIIVAHSLGSNITADMLRFLNKSKDVTEHKQHYAEYLKFAFAGNPQGKLPIYFFSMGCPLRQLLNRFFPHLYQWIREAPEDSGVSVVGSNHKLATKDSPVVADLRVAKWVNFYRSGDYIGRSVWINDVFARTPDGDTAGSYPEALVTHDDAAPGGGSVERIDACIGLGAHTHYWDRTAPDVGNQLDTLIAI